jgi:membrane dipeptidase
MSKKNDSGLSRRRFLTTAAGAGGAALLGPTWLQAASETVDPRLAPVKRTTIAIDMHNHIFSGAAGLGAPTSQTPGPEAGPPLLLSEQIKLAGLTAAVAGYKIPFDPNAKPGETNEKLLSYLTTMDNLLEKEHMSRALTVNDLEAAHRRGQPTIVQAIEGAQFLEGHLERIEVAYKRGLRHLQLLHDNDDPVSPQGDLDSKPAHLGGLTPFGAEAIKECNRLGILVDLAHGSPETILAATKVATKPFIVSHTGFDYPVDETQRMFQLVKPRRLTKERAKVIADQGGVIGIWVYLARSPKEYVEDVKHTVDAVGIDHVGIGTDTDLLSPRAGSTNSAWPGMTGGFFNTIAAEMLVQGFTPSDIAKFGGGNYCRVFGKATAGHA